MTDLVEFASYEGIEDHASSSTGAGPRRARTPVEATLSEGGGDGARRADRRHGSTRVAAGPVAGGGRRDHGHVARRTRLTRTGSAEPLALDGHGGGRPVHDPRTARRRGGDLVAGPLAEPLDAQWRAIPDVAGFTPDTLDAVGGDIARASRSCQRGASVLEPGVGRDEAARRSSPRSTGRCSSRRRGSSCSSSSSASSPGTRSILVAALLLERSRTEIALLRARGAGTGHLAAMAFGEGCRRRAGRARGPVARDAPRAGGPAQPGDGGRRARARRCPGPRRLRWPLSRASSPSSRSRSRRSPGRVNISGVRAAVGRQVGEDAAAAPRPRPRARRSSRRSPSCSCACTARRSPATPGASSAPTRSSSPPRRSGSSAARSSRSGSCPGSRSSPSACSPGDAASSPPWAAGRSRAGPCGIRGRRCSSSSRRRSARSPRRTRRRGRAARPIRRRGGGRRRPVLARRFGRAPRVGDGRGRALDRRASIAATPVVRASVELGSALRDAPIVGDGRGCDGRHRPPQGRRDGPGDPRRAACPGRGTGGGARRRDPRGNAAHRRHGRLGDRVARGLRAGPRRLRGPHGGGARHRWRRPRRRISGRRRVRSASTAPLIEIPLTTPDGAGR